MLHKLMAKKGDGHVVKTIIIEQLSNYIGGKYM